MEENNVEKRRCKRVRTHVPVRYRGLKAGAGEPGSATLSKNLSSNGVRFKAAEFISIATRLILEMDIPLLNKPVKAISKIAWIRKASAGEDYDVGSYFLEMSKKDKEIVSEYIDEADAAEGTEQAKS